MVTTNNKHSKWIENICVLSYFLSLAFAFSSIVFFAGSKNESWLIILGISIIGVLIPVWILEWKETDDTW